MSSSPSAKLKEDVKHHLKDGITIIVLGASGDLAKKKTFPALFALFSNHFLPKNTQIVGYARSQMDLADFHGRIKSFIKSEDEAKINNFLKLCHYVQGQYDKEESWKNLDSYITDLENKQGLSDEQKNRLFYVALPPSVFVTVASGLRKYVYGKSATNSIVIEKPFGKDLNSCQDLIGKIKALYKEEELYRIDHYLGKELAKDIMTIRFSNMIFCPLWTRTHIDSVQITLKEPFGTEGRGGYFDEFGIIRDVMQNRKSYLIN